jgi:microcystin-dependent protein
MGGTSANRLTDQSGGLDGDVLGDTGGTETHTLVTGEMPAHTHVAEFTVSNTPGGTAQISANGGGVITSVTDTTTSAGGDGAHNNVQPTIILNYIIKV